VPQLSLRQSDAQILYLGLLHREAGPRPAGDQRSGEPSAGSRLTSLRATLEAELARAVAEIEVPDEDLPALSEALGGAINELKQLSMADGRSMVPGFGETAQRLFPEIAEEPGAALDVVGHGVMLRRRLDAAVAATRAAAPAPDTGRDGPTPRRRWWRPWRR
jgi:hypothetical protein